MSESLVDTLKEFGIKFSMKVCGPCSTKYIVEGSRKSWVIWNTWRIISDEKCWHNTLHTFREAFERIGLFNILNRLGYKQVFIVFGIFAVWQENDDWELWFVANLLYQGSFRCYLHRRIDLNSWSCFVSHLLGMRKVYACITSSQWWHK